MEEELKRLQTENQELREQVKEQLGLREQNQSLQEQVKDLQKLLSEALSQIEELKKQTKDPPAFVKAKVSKSKKEGPRKKRAKEHNGARKREARTHIEEHLMRTCPDCQGDLSGINISRRRQIVELPPPPPVQVTEYRVYKGWCASCQKWHEAPFELPEGAVMGQGRLGVRISTVIAYLRTVMRLPIRQVQSYLQTLHGLSVSVGEIVEIQHRMRKHTAEAVQQLKAQVRASPASQVDETGWRENGHNGYVWSVNTPTIRYDEYHHSRGGKVVTSLLGENYEGVLGSDFYAGYNAHLGLHQRCWVHFLRDIHDLKKRYPNHEELLTWSKDVKVIYDRATAYAGPDPALPVAKQEAARRVQQRAFEQELWAVCAPYAQSSTPMQTLCKRVQQFLPELFVFVAIPGVPSHNNLAERSVRPLVIARKISGGTRSPQGSQTRMALFSLFSTWIAQGLDPFCQCLSLLSQPSLLPFFHKGYSEQIPNE
jgi:transposase